MTIIKPNNMT